MFLFVCSGDTNSRYALDYVTLVWQPAADQIIMGLEVKSTLVATSHVCVCMANGTTVIKSLFDLSYFFDIFITIDLLPGISHERIFFLNYFC